jgi:branched-chain amino acid transport system permease protein
MNALNDTVTTAVPVVPAEALPPTVSRTFWTLERLSALGLLIVLLALPFFVRNFVVFQLATCLILAIAILSLNLLTGVSGQFSLGHSAFYGVGAYAAGILMTKLGVNYLLAIPAAGVVAFVVGFLFGLPARRLSGVYLALATFALAVATPQIIKLHIFDGWTGGVQGLHITKPHAPFDIEGSEILGLRIRQDTFFYYFTLTVALLVYWASVNLVNSRSGRAMLAIRDNAIAASSMGINVGMYKSLAFGISAGITGIAGALGAMSIQFIAPDAFTFFLAVSLFLGMVVGGVGWLPGSLAGAVFVVFAPNLAETLAKGLPDSVSKGLIGVLFGLILIVIIFVVPRGAQQLVYALRNLVRKFV